jgi:hypothetical protein
MAQYAKYVCPKCRTEHYIEYDKALENENACCKNKKCRYVRPLYTYEETILDYRPARLDANFVTRSGETVHRRMGANTVMVNINDDPTMFRHPILVEVDTGVEYDVFYEERSYDFGRGMDEKVDIVYKDNDQPYYRSVSRKHCSFVLRKEEDRYMIAVKDAGSSYGTFVKGQKLRPDQEIILSRNEEFTLAKVNFKFIDKL